MAIVGERSYFHSLYQVAAEMNSACSTEEALSSIVEITARVMGAKGCSLMLLTPDRKLLLHTTAYGLSDWYIRKGSISADRSISEALEGEPVSILDATRDVRIQYQRQAEQEGIVSILCVPMILRGQVIGVMRVYTGEMRDFTDDDVYFTCAVANLGAIALENATLFETSQKEREALRQEMLERRATWGKSG
ncbi:GAF domain-containing protein [Chloroflexota bacterium]